MSTRALFLISFLFLDEVASWIDVTKDLTLPNDLDHLVKPLLEQATELFASETPSPMDYSIFDGRSSLRKLPEQPRSSTTKAFLSLQLLLQNKLDAAHDVILGVNWENVDEAEYAATHRGKTNWTEEHPFSDEDNIIHSLIHRLEGDLEGEGGYRGWDNAKYWIAGGPKQLTCLGNHAVHQAMRRICPSIAPSLTDLLVSKERREHNIIAGGGKQRIVWIDKDCFDPISFICLCQHVRWNEEMKALQVLEVLLLIRYELLKMCGHDNTDL